MASVDLGQSGAPLPSTTVQLSPQSFTMATQHVEDVRIELFSVLLQCLNECDAVRERCIHALRKNNNIVTIPTRDVLRHFCKMSLMISIRGCTLLSLMYS